MKYKNLLLCFVLILFSPMHYALTLHEASQQVANKYRYPGYLGVTYGYGATTWGYLIPPEENAAMNLSTPVEVSENGSLWGLFGGYEFNPFFALEAAYMYYPRANVYFDPYSIFTYDNDGLTGFVTHTQSVSLIGKFMVVVPKNNNFRIYSSVGAAGVHRDDIMLNQWQLSPKFGVGLVYLITPHIMTELGIEYVAGAAVSELNPAESFIPFLYSGFVRLAMRL